MTGTMRRMRDEDPGADAGLGGKGPVIGLRTTSLEGVDVPGDGDQDQAGPSSITITKDIPSLHPTLRTLTPMSDSFDGSSTRSNTNTSPPGGSSPNPSSSVHDGRIMPTIPGRRSSRQPNMSTFLGWEARKRFPSGVSIGDGARDARFREDAVDRDQRDDGIRSAETMDRLIAQINPRAARSGRRMTSVEEDEVYRWDSRSGNRCESTRLDSGSGDESEGKLGGWYADTRGERWEPVDLIRPNREHSPGKGLGDSSRGSSESTTGDEDAGDSGDSSEDGPAHRTRLQREHRRRRKVARHKVPGWERDARDLSSSPSSGTASPRMDGDGLATREELRRIAEELRGPSSAPLVQRPVQEKIRPTILSIDEIIKKHTVTAPHAFTAPRKASTTIAQPDMIKRSRTAPPLTCNDTVRATDTPSMAEMVRQSDALLRKLSDDRSSSLDRRGSVATTSTSTARRTATTAQTSSSGRSATSFDASGGSSGPAAAPIMEYLRSKRLNRLVTLQRSNQAGQVISVADVGNATGHPVVVFFGLGCVRYLVALFDELAESLNLRLVCIDRWGLGKSTDVSADRRGLLEWADVVDEVMDQLKVRKFGILAHSAGAPYALAVAYKLEQRISGKAHLLAPWVNADIDGGYKWLRYVPTGLLKTAQATEWKVQGWMLGRLPMLQPEGIGHDARAPSSFDTKSGIVNLGGQAKWMEDDDDADDDDDASGGHLSAADRTFESASSLASWAEVNREEVMLSPKPDRNAVGGVFLGGMLSAVSKLSSAPTLSPSPSPPMIQARRPESRASNLTVSSTGGRSLDLGTRSLIRTASHAQRFPNVAEHNTIESSLVTSLLQASHAETLSGGTADLLAIMGRDSKPWGFQYEDVHVPCRIWYGEKDDKISEKSMRWMERQMKSVELQIIRGEGHNLLTSSAVMMEVLESLGADAAAL